MKKDFENREAFHKNLDRAFSNSELKDYFFFAGVDSQNIIPENAVKSDVIQAVISYVEREKKIKHFIQWLKSKRPTYDWDNNFDDDAEHVFPQFYGPSLDTHFIGRDEDIKKITDSMICKDRDPIVVITGIPGCGKTQLAIKVSHNLAYAYPDFQICIEMAAHKTHPLTAEQGLASILRRISPEKEFPSEVNELNSLYLKLLAGKRALILLDDVANDTELNYFTPPKGCALLVTSRNRLIEGRLIEIGSLQENDSIKLLKEFVPDIEDIDAKEIAIKCNNLAVSLKIVGGLLKKYRSLLPRLLSELGHEPLKYLPDLTEIISFSETQLTKEELKVWKSLSIVNASFNRDTAIAISGVKQTFLTTPHPIDELVARNLLSFDAQSQRFSWHDTLYEYVAQRFQIRKKMTLRSRYTDIFYKYAAQVNSLFQAGETQKALKLFDQERIHFQNTFQLNKETQNLGEFINFIDNLDDAIKRRFHSQEQIAWLKAKLKAIDQAKGFINSKTKSKTLKSLGSVYYQRSDNQNAIAFFQEALIYASQANDIDIECDLNNNLGVVYDTLGDKDRALKYYKQALSIAQKINDPKKQASILNNIGLILDQTYKSNEAIEYFNEALQLIRNLKDLDTEGFILSSLGLVYQHIGETRKAIVIQENALIIASKTENLWLECLTQNNIGEAYKDIGYLQEAKDFYKKALKTAEDLGEKYYLEAILSNLGLLYTEWQESNIAVEYYNQALEIADFLQDKQRISRIKQGLALAHVDQGKIQESISMVSDALLLAKEVGDKRIEVDSLFTLGTICEHKNDLKSANDYYKSALTLAKEIKYHNKEWQILWQVANINILNGDFDIGIQKMQEQINYLLNINHKNKEIFIAKYNSCLLQNRTC